MAYPVILFVGVQQIQLRTGQRERGCGGGSLLVRVSGDSCNLVQEISFSKVFLVFGTLRLYMITTNLFVIANAKQLRTGGSFRILLRFFRISWSVGVLNSAILTVFTIGLSLTRFWKTLVISGEGGVWTPYPPPSRYTNVWHYVIPYFSYSSRHFQRYWSPNDFNTLSCLPASLSLRGYT